MVKVGDYMVSEQKVAFTIMDFENLIDELKDDGVITPDEHSEFGEVKNIIRKSYFFLFYIFFLKLWC